MRALRFAVAAIALAAFPLSVTAAPCAGFLDVEDSSPFCLNVSWMKNRAITLGCAAQLYCPTRR